MQKMDANLTNKCGENEEIGTEKESIQIRKSKKRKTKTFKDQICKICKQYQDVKKQHAVEKIPEANIKNKQKKNIRNYR